uniref:G protein-coupled receptor n=1 Tax=Haemonchus contortus TaxID=6289 RepID=A0A7I5EAI8_HAECO
MIVSLTKSTVRTTMNVQPVAMAESTASKFTNLTQSYHVEQLLTNHVLTADPRTLLALTLVAFASAIQVLIFAIICVFYDGCPYYIGVIIGILLLVNATVIFIFCKCRPTRGWLVASCVAASLSFVQSVSLFFWTAYLVNNEDKYLERIGANENRIVTSTRIAMYSLQMIFSPIHAIAAAIPYSYCSDNMRSLGEEKVTRGYFLSEPQLGHQKILVPIELRQVRDMSDDETENAS